MHEHKTAQKNREKLSVVLRTDSVLGLYALVADNRVSRIKNRLMKAEVQVSVNPESSSHLAVAGQSVLVFGGQHPLGVRDVMEAADTTVEVDAAVVLAETTYHPPVEQLLRMGAPDRQGKTIKYAKLGIGRRDIPELIRMVTDEALHTGPVDSEIYWGPLHAWRALAELRSEEAVAPLLGLLRLVDENEDDWVAEDIPEMLAKIGPAALSPTGEYLADPSHGCWARVAAAKAIGLIAEHHPKAYHDCVARLRAQLEQYATQSPALNAFLILPLLDLHAVESAPVMEKAFAAGCVDEDVQGDWEDVQIAWGMKAAREHERKPSMLSRLGDRFRSVFAEKTASDEVFEPCTIVEAPQQLIASEKVGRNARCPCGSGMKFKKCCGK